MNPVYDDLFTWDDNVLYLLPLPLADLAQLETGLRAAHPHAVIRRIEGERCRTTRDFFRTIAVALDFPDPHISWNILNERLFDLTWLPADAYLLLIDNADHFLAEDHSSNLHILLDIFNNLHRYPPTSGVRWVPRKLLLHSVPDALPALMGRLNEAQATPVLLQSEDIQ